MRNSRVGSDLEYAVLHNKEYRPAGFLPITGVKGRPEQLEYGGVEIDCCAVEITPHPARNEDQFVSNILRLLDEVKARHSNVTLHTVPSVFFPEKLLKETPHANVMGCEPDFNAWSGEQNPKPESTKGLRSFGGHVHIEDGSTETIKACDMILGMWSVVRDSDQHRRKLYGKAGAFRPKPYGVEYRTLSNFWCDKEENIRTVFRLVRQSQEVEGDVADLCERFGGSEVIQGIINNSDVERAKPFLDYFGVKYAA